MLILSIANSKKIENFFNCTGHLFSFYIVKPAFPFTIMSRLYNASATPQATRALRMCPDAPRPQQRGVRALPDPEEVDPCARRLFPLDDTVADEQIPLTWAPRRLAHVSRLPANTVIPAAPQFDQFDDVTYTPTVMTPFALALLGNRLGN
jgi:hypothetical protein